MKKLTKWEQACEDARRDGTPLPALVMTIRDEDGTAFAELVVERGCRLVVSPPPKEPNGPPVNLIRLERIED